MIHQQFKVELVVEATHETPEILPLVEWYFRSFSREGISSLVKTVQGTVKVSVFIP